MVINPYGSGIPTLASPGCPKLSLLPNMLDLFLLLLPTYIVRPHASPHCRRKSDSVPNRRPELQLTPCMVYAHRKSIKRLLLYGKWQMIICGLCGRRHRFDVPLDMCHRLSGSRSIRANPLIPAVSRHRRPPATHCTTD